MKRRQQTAAVGRQLHPAPPASQLADPKILDICISLLMPTFDMLNYKQKIPTKRQFLGKTGLLDKQCRLCVFFKKIPPKKQSKGVTEEM